ncbi:MAG: L-threonylcarbamoyladenylate synthase [Gammaproteobacteria bacterium]|nr:L-threonylcarbamoyladenylate synthase [Gammaproteobacteria bacterium]
MTQRLNIHPQNPQPRLIRQVVDLVKAEGLLVYPTDSCYAFGCSLGNLAASRAIGQIRQIGKNHNFTLMCRDLSEIAIYARLENWMYRLLRSQTPGPFTFILKATRDVPRRLQNPKRKTIGIRVPQHPVTEAILTELGEPIMSSTLLLPGSDLPLNDPDVIYARLEGRIDMLVDSGSCGVEPTTVVDLTSDFPVVVRAGKGDTQAFG